jgi:DNA polymerase
MREIDFDPTFDGWRAAARQLLAERVRPDEIVWTERGGEQPLLGGLAVKRSPDDDGRQGNDRATRVSRAFLASAPPVACFRDETRWPLLYRVLWRLTHGEPRLMDVVVDPDVHRMAAMEKAVRRDVHKMHAFVRFRRVDPSGGDGSSGDGESYVAWFRPEHLVVEYATPFFARRFATMRWSILGPDRSAYRDGHRLHFGPGVPRSAAPPPDVLEALWRTYFAHIFNPARMKLAAMRAEMPKKYWDNLPEAALIPGLVHDAPARVAGMIERARRELTRPAAGRTPRREELL